MKEDLDVSILICCHNATPFVKTKFLTPIQAGRAIANEKLDYCIGDDTGDNISRKNRSWCELTVLYWQWKNVNADYYGLFHYRRYLSFLPNDSCSYQETGFDDATLAKHGWRDDIIANTCRQADIITAPIWNIHPAGLPERIMTSYELYQRDHHARDLDIVAEIVKKDFSFLYPYYLEAMSDKVCFFGNIQVMKREYFHEYCAIIFPLLETAETLIDITHYDTYQKRIWGFIAERIANTYLNYVRRKYVNIRIQHNALVMFDFYQPYAGYLTCGPSNNTQQLSQQQKGGEVINISMSFDDNYFVHADVTITSILQCTASTNHVNFYILCDEKLTQTSRDKLIKSRPNNFTIYFIEVPKAIFSFFPLNRQYISVNTYYRLVIQKFLPSVDKVIYIDSDTIVMDDIAQLWNIPIDDYYLAGALDEGGVLQSRRLNLGYANSYFNAGVLIFNLAKIRSELTDLFTFYVEIFFRHRYEITLQDQDILNIAFKDSTKILPLRWNVNSRLYEPNFLERKYTYSQAKEAISHPGIIHFTDARKPWKFNCKHPLRELYWQIRNERDLAPPDLREKLMLKLGKDLFYKAQGNKVLMRYKFLKFSVKKSLLLKLIQLKIIKL